MLTSMSCAFSVVPVNCRWPAEAFSCRTRTDLGWYLHPSVPRLRPIQYTVVNASGGDVGDGGGDADDHRKQEIGRLESELRMEIAQLKKDKANLIAGKSSARIDNKITAKENLLTEVLKVMRSLRKSAKPAAGVNVPKIDWLQQSAPVYSLREKNLFFVNRVQAVDLLQTVHHSNYVRAIQMSGSEWVIPLADNIAGMGKSAFGMEYIRSCCEMWPAGSRETFEQTLCNAHTIAVNLITGSLVDKNKHNAVMIKCLKDSLRNSCVTPPGCLDQTYATAHDLLKEVVQAGGPIFIFLDEIGNAFEGEGLDDFQKRDIFLDFCNKVLSGWISNRNIFLLLAGRASFLGYVGMRPTMAELTESKFLFLRPSLNCLRLAYIKEILQNTLLAKGNPTTLQDYFGLSQDSALTSAAQLLFDQTNGHPRTLLSALEGCVNRAKIAFDTPISFEMKWSEWLERYVQHRTQVDRLFDDMENKRSVDLTVLVTDRGGKTTSLESIASNAYFSWEGQVAYAKLSAPQLIRDFLRAYERPFRKYLQRVAQVDLQELDYADVWEWMLLKRLQELFSKVKTPREASPDFFDTPFFGSCIFCLSKTVRPFPMITDSGKQTPAPKLDDSTAVPDSLSLLMQEVYEFDNECLKPRPRSSSPDVFTICKAKINGKEQKLIILVVAKNYEQKKFGKKQFEDELMKASRMFPKNQRKKTRNVLIVAATNYDQKYQKMFAGKSFFVHCQDDKQIKESRIDEIVFLDLTTPDKLAKFFGLIVNDAMMKTILAVKRKGAEK